MAVTYEPGAFNNDGLYSNGGDALFRKIGASLAPNDAPPTRPALPPPATSTTTG